MAEETGQDRGPEVEAKDHEAQKHDAAHLRRLVLGTVVVVAIVVVAGWLALRATASPGFYKLFPWLSEYTASWKASSHAKVSCTECHFPPGIGGSARQQAVALSLIADRLTGVHTRDAFRFPGNRSCAQKGCHADILGEKGDVVWQGVRFSHASHLEQKKRGISLACTTCHQQVVHGKEKPVDVTSCMTCHFKGLKWEEDISRCQLCHEVDTLKKARFDHTEVLEKKMDCKGCHADISRGDGAVDRERCISCHPAGDRDAKFADVSLVHNVHVQENGFSCTFCHHPIEHTIHPITVADDQSCSDCHRNVHEAQRSLYLGLDAAQPSSKVMPDPMAKVHVHCEGCHSNWSATRDGDVRKPSGKACNDCHGPGYDRILRQWSGILRRDLAAARTAVSGAKAALKGRKVPAEATKALQDASRRLLQVEVGHGEHNITFAVTQLDGAVADANRALAKAGLGTRYPRIADAKKLTASECARCHLQTPTTVRYEGAAFPHEKHVEAVGDCESCHTPYSDHGKLSWGKEACATCHQGLQLPHPKNFRKTMGRVVKKVGFDTCMGCHDTPASREKCTPCHLSGPAGELEWKGMPLSHANHAKHDIDCVTCHTELDHHGGVALTPAECNECHGLTMPHPDDFAETHGQMLMDHKVDLDTCSTCHEGGMPGEFCQTCHG